MKILVVGGTHLTGPHIVHALVAAGHDVTVANRGQTPDDFGTSVTRVVFDRTDPESIQAAFAGAEFDSVVDTICYCSNDVKNLLDVVKTERYVFTSSAAVYMPQFVGLTEKDFDPYTGEVAWVAPRELSYGHAKREAERALFQTYAHISGAAVRFPVIFGRGDRSGRLQGYVENLMAQRPIKLDKLEEPMPFVDAKEGGEFIAFLAQHKECTGPFHAVSSGTVTMGDIARHVEKTHGKKATFAPDGAPCAWDGAPGYSLLNGKAEKAGFLFSHVTDWVYELVDYYCKGE